MKKLILLFGIFALCSCDDDNGVSSYSTCDTDVCRYDKCPTIECKCNVLKSNYHQIIEVYPEAELYCYNQEIVIQSSSSIKNTIYYSSSSNNNTTLLDVCNSAAEIIARDYATATPELKCTEYVNTLQYISMPVEDAALCVDYVGCTDIILNLYGSSTSSNIIYCNMDNYCEQQVQAELAGMGVGRGSGATKTIEERCGCIFNN